MTIVENGTPNELLKWIASFQASELAEHGWTTSSLLKVAQDYPHVAVRSGSQLASVVFYQEIGPSHLEVLFLGTAPQERRKGHLSLIFLHFFRAYPQLCLWLECREDNHSARALYGKHGFRETGRRSKYYSDGKDAILMEYSQNKPG